MMYGGKIEKHGRRIDNSLIHYDWYDEWLEENTIHYAGELTDEICQAITQAWNEHPMNQAESSRGMLRWFAGSTVVRIDRERKVIITRNQVNLCD